MDLSKLSDADLLALHKGDLQSISNEGLQYLHGAQQAQPVEQTLTWSDVPAQAASNIGPNALKVTGETAQAVIHPIDTVQGILDLGNAALQKVLPESVNQFMHNVSPETAKNPEKLNAAIDFYKNRYGSEEGFKQALANNPAEVFADVSTVLTGGGALASKVPQLAKAGQLVGQVGRYVDPMAGIAKTVEAGGSAVGAAIPAILGTTTGVGGQTVKEAYNAGKAGGEDVKQLVSAMRGKSELSDPVERMREALKNMRGQATNQYNQGMEGIRANTNPVDLLPIEQAINSAIETKKIGGFDLDPKLNTSRQDVVTALEDFKTAMAENPELNSIYGLDALKQRVGSIADWGDPRSPETMMVRGVTGAIKDEIAKQSPEYADIMRQYGTAAEKANDIEKTLSLGKKAREETAIGKAQGLTRNNVNTSYGHRLKLAQELQNYSDENFLPEIYGQALSNKAPRGLGGVTAGGVIGAGITTLNPWAAPAASLTSPRLVGEAAVKTGQLAKLLRKGADVPNSVLDSANINPRILANLLYQTQPKEAE